jgi:5'(3')-deoxyribonucleotidase
MKIGIDLDGVCYPFVDEFRNWMKRNYSFADRDLRATQWNFFEDWGMSAREFNAQLERAHDESALWHYAHPTEGAANALYDLAEGHTIHIVTHRPEYAKQTTEHWLHDQRLTYSELIFAEDKTKWGLDVLLDDAPHNILAARAAGIRAITFDQPWNQHVTGERVKSWAGFVAAIKGEQHNDWVRTVGEYMAAQELAAPKLDFETVDLTDEEMERIIALDEFRVYTNPPRAELLDEAKNLIVGDRNNQYGPPTKDFERTAAMWAAYKGVDFTAHDVAAMMALLKISRIAWSPTKRDHWADLAGYAGCGYETTLTSAEA